MVAKSFEVGDLVWAKMKGFSFWPGQIDSPPSEKSPKVKKSQHYVFFYGSNDFAWIPDENILLHNDRVVASYGQKYKSSIFKKAVEKIIKESKNNSKYQKSDDENFEDHEENEVNHEKHESSFGKHASKNSTPKSSSFSKAKVKLSVKKDAKKKKRTLSFDHGENKRKRSHSFDHNESKRKCTMSYSHDNKSSDFSFPEFGQYLSLYTNVPPNLDYNGETIPSSLGLISDVYVERPNTPPLDLDKKSVILKEKKITPTKKKIGFMGLGKLGQGIVKNLIHSGHSVIVWSTYPERCDLFVNIGAKSAQTPADVVSASDITFCCVSDTDVGKSLVFGNCGILKGLDSCHGENKGYVEMTSMDPQTSQAIAREIERKGGRYLEAPINGSRLQAIEGTLFIMGAGDKSLFDECESCFQAIASHTMYLGDNVGSATKFNIVHSMLVGTVYAALAESLALIERTGLREIDFLNTLQYSILNNKLISEKGMAMINKEYTCNTPLKNVQRDLNLGLMVGFSCQQPLPIFAATNEAYKHLKLLRYEDHDVSAIYEGTRR